jgi:tetratricopeptide (TPR) repeat protein
MRLASLMFVAGIILGGAVASAETAQDRAQAYNLEAMRAYRQFDWKAAEGLFRKALKEDPDHKLANYNLACVLSLELGGSHYPMRVEERGPDDPLEQLARAIKVDPDAARKAAHDADFTNVRLMPRFQILVGGDLTDPTLLKIILVAQGEWYGPRCGERAWCGHNLLFFPDGQVQKKVLTQDAAGKNVFQYISGTYSIEGGVIVLRVGSEDVVRGTFDERGVLHLGTDLYAISPDYDM